MKKLILLAGLTTAALSASAQTLSWHLKAGAAVTQTRLTDMALRQGYSSGYPYYELQDSYAYEAAPRPGCSAGIAGHWQSRGHWGAGAELLAAYEPLRLRRRDVPSPYSSYIGPLDDNLHEYRYALPRLVLPVYATYRAGQRWQLRLGAAPSLLLSRQVRISGPEPQLVGGQAVSVMTEQRLTDQSLRRLNLRLLLGLQYQLTPALALELSALPALTELTDTDRRDQLLVRRHLRQHALQAGVSYALRRP